MDDQLEPGILIGRDEQLLAVTGALDSPRHSGAVVVAPAGLGKTALLHAVMAAEEPRFRFIPLAAGTVAGMAVPYGALTPMLGRLPVGPEPLALDVLRTVQAFVGAGRGSGRRPVIVIDDADELDAGSAWIISQLALSGQVRILASARPGTREGDLAALVREGILQPVELTPLAPRQRDGFCSAVLQAPALPAGVRMLGQASGGNPRTLGLLLQQALQDGSLVRRNGAWVLLGELPGCSRALLDATKQELSRLDEAGLAGVTVLSLLGPADRGAAEQFLSPDTIDALAAAGYVEFRPAAGGGQRLQLTAALHEESLRRLAPVVLKRRVCQWFQGLAGPLPALQQQLAARWAMEIGETVRADQLLAAAEAANADFRPGAAVLMATAAGSAGAGPAAAVQLARARMYQGQFMAAQALVRDVIETAADPETVTEAARLAIELAQLQGRGPAGLDELASSWEDALARLRQHPAGEVPDGTGPRLLRLQARFAAGHPAGILDEVEQLARACADRQLRVQALVLLAEVRSSLGLAVQGTAAALLALEQLDGGRGTVAEPQQRIRLVRQLIRNGELAAADRQLAVLESSEAMLVFGGSVDFLKAWLDLKRGHFDRARGLLAVAVEGLRQCDPLQLLPYALGRAAAAGALVEDRQAAARYMDEFGGLGYQGGPETSLLAQAYVVKASALFDGASPAVERLADIARILSDAGLLAAELEVRMLMVRLGDRDRLGEMIRCAEAMEGPEADVYLGFAQALDSRCGRQALTAAEKAAGAGYLVVAEEAAAHSVSQFAGQANHRQAREAGRFLQQLRRQRPELGGLRRPAGPAGRQLTQRERDVAVMAANGARSREIAARLGVSVRTVEGHIYRIYEKLDIRSREELAARFGKDLAWEAAAPQVAGR